MAERISATSSLDQVSAWVLSSLDPSNPAACSIAQVFKEKYIDGNVIFLRGERSIKEHVEEILSITNCPADGLRLKLRRELTSLLSTDFTIQPTPQSLSDHAGTHKDMTSGLKAGPFSSSGMGSSPDISDLLVDLEALPPLPSLPPLQAPGGHAHPGDIPEYFFKLIRDQLSALLATLQPFNAGTKQAKTKGKGPELEGRGATSVAASSCQNMFRVSAPQEPASDEDAPGVPAHGKICYPLSAISKALPESVAAGFLEDTDKYMSECAAPMITVAVVGPTGCGKSTLLNALTGEELLPTSGSEACTATHISIRAWSRDFYSVTVHFMSEGELDACFRLAVGDLTDVVDEDSAAAQGSAGDLEAAHEAKQRLAALGLPTGTDITVRGLWAVLHVAIRGRLGTTDTFPEKSAEACRARIQKFAASWEAGDCSAATAPDSEDHFQLWPLVTGVEIALPASRCNLPKGVVLVDLPGTGDANRARGNVAARNLADVSCTLVAAEFARAADKEESRCMLMSRLGDHKAEGTRAIFVATQLDAATADPRDQLRKWTPESIDRLAGLKPGAYAHTLELAEKIENKLAPLQAEQRRLSREIQTLQLKEATGPELAVPARARGYDASNVQAPGSRRSQAVLPAVATSFDHAVASTGVATRSCMASGCQGAGAQGTQGAPSARETRQSRKRKDAEPSAVPDEGGKLEAGRDGQPAKKQQRRAGIQEDPSVVLTQDELEELRLAISAACERKCLIDKQVDEVQETLDHVLQHKNKIVVRAHCQDFKQRMRRKMEAMLPSQGHTQRKEPCDQGTPSTPGSGSEHPIPMFAVSAKAYFRKADKASAFADVAETNIPALREELQGIAADAVAKHARSLAGNVAMLLQTIANHFRDAKSLDEEQRRRITTAVNRTVDVMLPQLVEYEVNACRKANV
eukprot:jgi/Mesvir1/14859/Mv05474-RA.2